MPGLPAIMVPDPFCSLRTPDRDRYAKLMWEARLRLEVVSDFLQGTASATYVQASIESMALQLRKLLELIAFSSLVSNRDAYEAVRSDIAKDWHANRILRRVESINPKFYPQPVDGFVGSKWKKVRSGFLTRLQFAELYDECGNILHVPNPLGRGRSSLVFQRKIPLYLCRLERLLSEHVVQLASSKELLWVKVPRDIEKPVAVRHLISADG